MKLKLYWQIFIGLALGVVFGLAAPSIGLREFTIDNIAVLGDIFLRALRMIIVPLIISAIISGVTSIGTKKSFGRLSLKTITYYVTTSLIAILTGLFLVNLTRPGVGAKLGFEEMPPDLAADAGRIGETLMGIIPTNPLEAMVNGEMLPIIFFSLLFGFFITRVPDPYRSSMGGFFQAMFEVMMRMTHFIIRFTPIGVFALMAKIVAQTGFDVFVPLGTYMLTVIGGLIIHGFITLPLLLMLIAGVSPLAHARAMFAALMTAFSTASSSATLPLTIDSVENNAGVSNRISSFVLPLGATINMDGTALYECVAAMFIAQVYGIELSFAEQAIVVFTALLASIGAAGIPMAGLVMITIILGAVGLPLEGIALILAVDRPLDMLRTATNVWSDGCGAVIIARSEGETDLKVLRGSGKQKVGTQNG